MPKKSVNKKKAPTKKQIEESLIENSVKLQKVLANLAFKFDSLGDQISKLLELFEIAAKSFVKKEEEGTGADKDLLIKIDTLLEQNKTLAKGLALMEEKVRHRMEIPESELHGVPMPHSEAELHGIYPNEMGRPRPKKFPGY